MRTTSPTGALRALPAADDQPQPGRLATASRLGRYRRPLAPGDRCERLGGRAAVLPARRDEPHPAHALHCAHDVYATADRPPPVTGLLHEREALEPARLADRRRVATEAPAVQLEAEELQPVAQPQQADE